MWSDLVIEQCLMRSLKSRGGLTRGRGMSESVRDLWVSSMHRCSSVYDAMGDLTEHRHQTSEQHVELRESRLKRDNDDCNKLIEWFDSHEPFDPNETSLKSISTGLIAGEKDDVNCDEAEIVGENIQKKLDNVCLKDAKIKRSERIKTLKTLTPGVKINNKIIHIDPLILFARLTSLIQREENISNFFSFELTPEPSSLFLDGLMRKSPKSVLREKVLKQSEPVEGIPNADVCVVDGGALLHQVKWPKNTTDGEVIHLYVAFVEQRYGQYHEVHLVFDGYGDKLSTKADEHKRRKMSVCSNIEVSENTTITFQCDAFFQNFNNKEQFIKLLSKALK